MGTLAAVDCQLLHPELVEVTVPAELDSHSVVILHLCLCKGWDVWVAGGLLIDSTLCAVAGACGWRSCVVGYACSVLHTMRTPAIR